MALIVTSKPGMTPWITCDSFQRAENEAEKAQSQGLGGEIVGYCDECGRTLDDGELDRNRIENEDEDGNSLLWCDDCASKKRLESAETGEDD